MHAVSTARGATSAAANARTEDRCSARSFPHQWGPRLRVRMSRPVKRSFTIGGHRTSISLEAPFWDALRAAAARENVSLAHLIASIDQERGGSGLSSAVRVWLLDYYRNGAGARST